MGLCQVWVPPAGWFDWIVFPRCAKGAERCRVLSPGHSAAACSKAGKWAIGNTMTTDRRQTSALASGAERISTAPPSLWANRPQPKPGPIGLMPTDRFSSKDLPKSEVDLLSLYRACSRRTSAPAPQSQCLEQSIRSAKPQAASDHATAGDGDPSDAAGRHAAEVGLPLARGPSRERA